MSKRNSALLRIRPIEYFFFGGESTFGNGEGANYFARSNAFPQQSTILGLLRRLLFDAKQHIGHSFDAGDKTLQDFGVIQSLSPVFLMDNGGKAWLPHALDAHEETPAGCGAKGFQSFHYHPNKNIGECFTGLDDAGSWTKAPYFDGADAKRSLSDCLIAQDGVRLQRKEVFQGFTRIGITKFRKGADPASKRDAFYKQEMYKLEAGWSFAVVLSVKNAEDLNFFKDKMVALGGEKCTAHLEIVQEEDASFEQIFQASAMYNNRHGGQIVLLSDAYVGEGFMAHCEAAIAEITPFRNIITPSQTKPKAYGPLKSGPNPDHLYKTQKYNLLKSGSVLLGDTQRISQLLEEQTHFRQIGYNHYLTF